MIDYDCIQRVRALPIEEVAEALGLRVGRHKALCPFHDDRHPSLTFNLRRNSYRCYVCDAHGGPIDLTMNLLRLSFPEACRWLAAGHHVILHEQPRTAPAHDSPPDATFDPSRYQRYFDRPFLSDEARRFLYNERRIAPRVVAFCRLTSYRDRQGTHWLQIPYFDTSGRLTGIQNRNLDYGRGKPPAAQPPTAEVPRFRFPRGSRCGIYNLPVLSLLGEGEPLFITEGCSDCWAMMSAGHKAIAIPSATLLKPRELERILARVPHPRSLNLHICPDQDPPGERLYLDLRERFPHLVRHQLPPGCKDFGQWWAEREES